MQDFFRRSKGAWPKWLNGKYASAPILIFLQTKMPCSTVEKNYITLLGTSSVEKSKAEMLSVAIKDFLKVTAICLVLQKWGTYE